NIHMRMLRMLYVALFLYGIRAAGEDGPNAYGLEFGEVADRDADMPLASSKMKAHQPVHRFGQVNKKAPAWGQRKRTGFGRR
ncbi:MAG: hypothetical protein AAFR55_09620, partial [Pseudomonadota bacterium]